jgi:hypothetical protein
MYLLPSLIHLFYHYRPLALSGKIRFECLFFPFVDVLKNRLKEEYKRRLPHHLWLKRPSREGVNHWLSSRHPDYKAFFLHSKRGIWIWVNLSWRLEMMTEDNDSHREQYQIFKKSFSSRQQKMQTVCVSLSLSFAENIVTWASQSLSGLVIRSTLILTFNCSSCN